MTLTDQQKAILEVERRWWRYAPAKEEAIRLRAGLSVTDYYQELNRLVDEPAAVEHDAVVVNRLRRLRDRRRESRAQGRVA